MPLEWLILAIRLIICWCIVLLGYRLQGYHPQGLLNRSWPSSRSFPPLDSSLTIFVRQLAKVLIRGQTCGAGKSTCEQALFQIKIPNMFDGKEFDFLFHSYVTRSILPLALYRTSEEPEGNQYVFTYEQIKDHALVFPS